MKKKVVIKESDIRRMVAESVRRILKEEFDVMNLDVAEKARELVKDVVWEEEVEDVDGGYATGYVYGEVEDENGEVWKFVGDTGFNWEGDWVIDNIESIEFEAPDGTTGTI